MSGNLIKVKLYQRGCITQFLAVQPVIEVSLNPITDSLFFIVQETLPSLLSTDWFQKWIQA